MSYHIEKTLSSIRSLIDEWSIRKEGGKQSFLVLKEIDKLLADTPIDDVVSSKDVADKKNEVTMLRLERDEMLIRRQLDRAKKETLRLDYTVVSQRIINKNLRRINTDQHKTIDGLEAELSARKEDSRVLMKVVEAVRQYDGSYEHGTMNQFETIASIVEDYLDAPEGVTIKTPSMGTRVVSKNEEAHIIDGDKMAAVRMLVGSDMWVLHTDEAAVEDKQQKETINKLNALLADEKMTLAAYRNNPLSDQVADRDKRIEQLIVLNEALRVDIELAHNLSRDHIAGQDRFIEGLKSRMTGARIIIDNQATSIEELRKDLDARNTVIKDFKAIDTKETDRLHTVIEGNGKIIDELNDMYCDACVKLERIEKIAGPSVRGRVCTRESVCRAIDEIVAIVQKGNAIDEITKIIQEE